MRNVHFLTSFFLGAMVFFSSCSSTKYVPKDQYLLKSVKVPLAVYSLSGRDSTKWINRTLKSMGEAPVVFDSLSSVQTCADLAQQLKNEGFLDAQVRLQVSTKGRKAKVEYLLQPGEPYFVDSIGYAIQDTTIARILSRQGASASLLYKGMKFDVSRLDAERKRISTLLSDSGYYRFHKDYITYQADSISHSRLINLTLHLAPYQLPNEEYVPHTRYWMRHINYGSGSPGDNQIHLRQHVLQECTHLHSGSPYSASGLQNTYNHFGRLQAVKYTNITFKQVPDADSLDCQILLQNNKPSTLSFQPEGTNTAGDLGAAASLTYQNRNLFRGSEVLSIQLRGAYEAIRGLEGYSNQNFVEYSAEAKLQFPRFISPFVNRRIRRLVNATSEVSLLYDMQDRPEFHRRLLSAAWRYKWSFPHRKDKFQVDVLDLNYVFMPWISETFHNEYLRNDNNRNAILRYNYEDLFITKIGFGYSITKGNTAFKSNIETSGNLLSLASRMWNAQKDELGHYQVFNIAFAQYVKCDLDLSHVLMIDKNNQLVFHAGLGVAYPYGNSTVMPFEKRYFSGGANSVRGWTVRSLGPGQYKEQDGRINFINQTGDMKLDLNAEYRTYLFWKFNGALFVDAGNIWTIRQYDEQPGGQFSFKDFPRQLAVSYGLGLRLNFDYFILRFDLGMKAVNPAYEAEDDEHYPVLHPNFKRDYAFHFAVGMPF